MLKPNFSVCLIAKNEEETLPHLLDSLKEFQYRGGMVLMLDTGSTDKTVEVAESRGVIVHKVGDKFVTTIDSKTARHINKQFTYKKEEPVVKVGDRLFDYASARNYIATFAPTDMIATPDCDEVYTKLDVEWINNVISEGAEQLEYNFVFSHDEYGNEAIKFMHSKFYNRKKLKWAGIIHEVLQGEAKREYLGEEIIKLEHYQNEKTDRSGYLKGLALDCFLNPDNDRNSHYLGRELLWTGRFRSAIQELKRHIAMEKWQTERSQSSIYIGDAYMNLGNEDLAIEYYHKAFDLEAGRREPLVKLAEFYYNKNDYAHTAFYVEAMLNIPLSNYYANLDSHYTNLPHELGYWAHWYLGNKQRSKYHFEEALKYQPQNPKYGKDAQFYYALPKVSFVITHMGKSEQRVAGLQKCIDSIKALNYPQEQIEIIVEEDTFEDRLGVPKRLKMGVEKSDGEIIVFASNDIEFTPNSLINAIITSQKELKALVAFNTGPLLEDEGNICEHFLIHKGFIPTLGGEIFDTEFHHVGVDNLLWAKSKKLEQATRSANALVNHFHFSKTGEEMDDVYKLGWSEQEADRALLETKLSML